MSVEYVQVGVTSWCRSWTCDKCGFVLARTPTGTRGTTTIEGEAPRVRLQYDEEEFKGCDWDKSPFLGWVRVERVLSRAEEKLNPSLHLCPTCAPALLDHLLTACRVPTETESKALNIVEVPR